MSKQQDRIKAARKAKRLTQGDLGDLVGVSATTISAIELGKFAPKETIEGIAKALKVDYNWLCTGIGVEPNGVSQIMEREQSDKDKLIEQLKSQVSFYEEVIRNLSSANFPKSPKKANAILRVIRGGAFLGDQLSKVA